MNNRFTQIICSYTQKKSLTRDSSKSSPVLNTGSKFSLLHNVEKESLKSFNFYTLTGA